MSMNGTKQPTYKDGRTKQSFKDETDIEKILSRAQKSGTISHLTKYEARYGDFSGFDFFEANIKMAAGAEIFAALPSEIRNEFQNTPGKFFAYVNDPDNKDRLGELLPELAAPGRQNISTTPLVKADEDTAALAAEKAAAEVIPVPEPQKPPVAPGEPTEPPPAS